MKNQKSKSVKSLSGTRGIVFALLIVIGLIQAVLTVLFALAVKNLINAAEYLKGSTAVITSAIYLAVCVSLIFIFSVIYRVLHAKCLTSVETNIKKTIIKKFISGDARNFASPKPIIAIPVARPLDRKSTRLNSSHIL